VSADQVALPCLTEGSLIIGDLHLDPHDPEDCSRFSAWLQGIAPPHLVVLGDLFDAWIGPKHEEAAGARVVTAALAALCAGGAGLHVLHGNRDFLLGPSFEAKTGAQIHAQGFDATLEDGTRLALIHGDELCSRDIAYQRLRRILRSPLLLALAPRLPRALAGAIARRLRRASTAALKIKQGGVKAMQEEACRSLARRRHAALVLAGHAHRARDEMLSDGPRWMVVDAFGGPQDLVVVGAGGTLCLAASGARAPAEALFAQVAPSATQLS
jgi:UDP-2,3-diacylglucosamine hydrolase